MSETSLRKHLDHCLAILAGAGHRPRGKPHYHQTEAVGRGDVREMEVPDAQKKATNNMV